MDISRPKTKGVVMRIGGCGLALGVILIIGYSHRSSPDYVPTITTTNVASISLTVTHGTNHTFYYRGRLRWELGQLCAQLGMRSRIESQRLIRRTFQPADTVWVACTHGSLPPHPKYFRAVVVNAQGRKHIFTSTGGVCDSQRRVSVSAWSLPGGIEAHRGSTLRIEDPAHGTELVSIQLR